MLTDVRSTLAEMIDFLSSQHQDNALGWIETLDGVAANDEDSPARVLAEFERSWTRVMGVPDGFDATFIVDGRGGVDREASRRLDGLKDRLARLVDEGAAQR